MDKQTFLEAVRDLRQKAVEELCRDEELGRYYHALQRLEEMEAKARTAGNVMAAAGEGKSG